MRQTMTIRIGFAAMFVVCLLLSAPWPGRVTEAEETALPVVAALQQPPRDIQPPDVFFTMPKEKRHNLFPAIIGTAGDREYIDPQTLKVVPPSGVARVEVSIQFDGQYWNGSGWVASADPAGVPLMARFGSGNWVLDTNLPAGDNLRFGYYYLRATAYDQAGNKSVTGDSVSIKKLTFTLWDANSIFANGLDFSDEHKTISNESLRQLAKDYQGNVQSFFSAWRFGAAADGASKILVIVKGYTPNKITIKRELLGVQAIDEDALTQINSSDAPTEIAPIGKVDLSSIDDGEPYCWMALYTVPDGVKYLRNAYEYRVNFTASMSGGPNKDMSEPTLFWLYPPPVLLVHGIWKDSWPLFGVNSSLENAGLDVYAAQYPMNSGLSFNLFALENNAGDDIPEILQEYRRSFRACTRVDVVAHSVGGLVSRQYTQTSLYRDKKNFQKGYIRRLVTIGTPHQGSRMANVLLALRNDARVGPVLNAALRSFLGDTEQKTLEDLQPSSPALQRIEKTDVSSYAIVGNIEPNASNLFSSIYYAAWAAAKFSGTSITGVDLSSLQAFHQSVFGNMESDGVVGGLSQRGGLSTAFAVAEPVSHLQEAHSTIIGDKIASLLSGPKSAFADYFPALALSTAQTDDSTGSANSRITTGANSSTESAPVVRISEPAEGSVFSPGSTFFITLQPLNGANLDAALILAGEGENIQAAFLEHGNSTTSFSIPNNFAGRLPIRVVAKNSQGVIGDTASSIIVSPGANVAAITALPDHLTLSGADQKAQLSVQALYTDGIVRDATSAAAGTRYSLSNTQIAAVSEDGLVTAKTSGDIVVTITNGAARAEVKVTIRAPMPRIMEVLPDELDAGTSNVMMTIKGSALGGATKVEFQRNGAADRAIMASIVGVLNEELLTTIKIAVTVAANAENGPRVIVVTTPDGQSDTLPSEGNVIAIKAASQQPLPAPAIANLDPSSKEAGGQQFVLTVNGSNFVANSQVMWNGSARPTTYESATKLRATILPADIAQPGTANVTVANPAASGGTSNAATFNILQPNNPVPTLTQLSPNSVTAGGANLTLMVTGRNFVNGAKVRWNGAERSTSFISPGELKATILAFDVASSGTANVTIFNPLPGGGESNAATFNILQPNNPIPALTQLSPNSVTAGSASFTLTVAGRNFVNGAKVRWNGTDKTTTFVSATELKAAITAADIAAPGMTSVTVFNSAPGGGISNALSFTITPSNGNAEQEPNQTSAQATPLTLPGKRTGTVAVGDAAYWVVSYQDGTKDGLEDLFALTVTHSSVIELKLTAANAAADLDLFLFKEENGSLSYLGYSLAGPGVEERIVTESALAPGRYLVAVSAFSGSSGYTLTAATPDSRLLSLSFNNTLTGAQGEAPLVSTGVSFGQGISGTGLSLPAGNQLFYSSAANINATEGTIELWIKPNWSGNDSKHHYIVQHGGAGGMLIGKDSANYLRLILNRYGAAGGVEIDTGFNIADWRANQWYHVAFTWSSSQKSVKTYINGVMKSERAFNQPLPAINNDRLQIGGDGNSGYLEAMIDELSIHNVALTANQIASRYQSP